MTKLQVKVIVASIRLLPRSFRERFGSEMLSAYLDQRDAILSAARDSRSASWRHTLRTVAGLVRASLAIRFRERRREHPIPEYRNAPRGHPMRNFARDTRHAVRVLRTRPAFAIVAIITLALGIGANTAVFSVVNSVILAPLPYDEPEQLVRVYTAYPTNAKQFSTGLDLLDIREQVTAFASMGIVYNYREVGADLAMTDGPPRRIRVLPVSADYFPTLRVTPLLGRTFARDEERGDALVAVLSHELWNTHMARDPGVIGRSVELDGVRYEVVGVMRPTFADPLGSQPSVWIPQELRPGKPPAALALARGNNSRQNHYLSAIARLARGSSVAQAQAQVDALVRRLKAQYPRQYEQRRFRVASLHEDVVGDARTATYVLMGAAVLVLLIACLNVANLFLVRALAQLKETAIRTALGAARARLVAQRLTESLVVATAGGLVGSVIAYLGVKALLAVSPESLPRSEAVSFDLSLLGFAVIVTIVTGALFGAGPAVRASRVNASDAMNDSARGTTGGRGIRQLRSVLVTSQISMALMLLVGAGVLIRAFISEQRRDLGFSPAGVVTFEVHLSPMTYGEPARRVTFHRTYLERLRSLPGLTHASATSWLPANGEYHVWGYEYVSDNGEPKSESAQIRVVDGSFLSTFEVPLLHGRFFDESDRESTAQAAIISQSLAKKTHGEGTAVGKVFRTGDTTFTVIGVVGDVANDARGVDAKVVYLSHRQFASDRNWALTYAVKSSIPAQETIALARGELARLDPALVLYRPRTMESVLAVHHARDRFMLLLMATFGAIALTLAAVGVYGVLSYAVTQRRREIGVRIALGAQLTQVRASVLGEGLIVAAVGVAFGAIGALGLARVLRSLALGVNPHDPVVFAIATLVLGAVVLIAGYLPARRATRVNPLEVLQSD
jgi:putative ABC transport system permease protein